MTIDLDGIAKQLLDGLKQDTIEIGVGTTGDETLYGYHVNGYRETVDIEDVAPAIFLSTTDVDTHCLARNDILVIHSVQYRIRELKRSGVGFVKLTLEDESSDP